VDSVTPDGPRRAPIRWHVATVRDARAESATARTLVLDVPGWPGHVAGQHVDVRLTAEDGYQAQRSYSIASAPKDATLALTVERLEDGEVSPYLTDELGPGDELELRAARSAVTSSGAARTAVRCCSSPGDPGPCR
jgi:ferredoxin-NADP reductase